MAVAIAACSHESPAAPSAPAATAAACTYLVSPTTMQIPSAGGTFQASVNTGAASGCQWTASTSNTWIRLAVTTTSQGTGAVAMTVDPILTMPTRHGAVTVTWTGGSQVINVDQASAPYAVRGTVTDAVRHAGIAGARVELQTAPNAYFAATAVTDNTGAYAIPGLAGGTYRVRVSANGFDLAERIVDVIQADLRVDFELRPPVAPAANYAGVWRGVYDVTDCRDIDIPGFTQFHLCYMHLPQSYQFTLTQTGTLVTGTYKLVTSFYSCPCQLDGGYGEIPMAGSISPDGTLSITALGNTRGLVGATAELDLLLRQPSPSTITGTGTIHLRFGTPDDRSIGSVVIQSGTRTQ